MYMDNIPFLSSSTRLDVFLTISSCDQCYGIGPNTCWIWNTLTETGYLKYMWKWNYSIRCSITTNFIYYDCIQHSNGLPPWNTCSSRTMILDKPLLQTLYALICIQHYTRLAIWNTCKRRINTLDAAVQLFSQYSDFYENLFSLVENDMNYPRLSATCNINHISIDKILPDKIIHSLFHITLV